MWTAMVQEGKPMAFELAPFRYKPRKSRRKLKRAGKRTNLIVINEECQLCQSTAAPVACSKCYTLLCGECVEDLKGKPVCSLCRDEVEKPKLLAKVLIFRSAASRRAERADASTAQRVTTAPPLLGSVH